LVKRVKPCLSYTHAHLSSRAIQEWRALWLSPTPYLP
jgi:hypothetical protein